jgi:hypothetical protein
VESRERTGFYRKMNKANNKGGIQQMKYDNFPKVGYLHQCYHLSSYINVVGMINNGKSGII